MIAHRWRRASTPIVTGAGRISRLRSRLADVAGALARTIVWQPANHAAFTLPSEGVDYGPFGRIGPGSISQARRGVTAAGRAAAAPFGSVVTVAVTDNVVRVMIARGNRVRRWSECALAEGVVQDGLIVDEETFTTSLNTALSGMKRGPKLNGAKVAVAIGGRNVVQRRFTLFIEQEDELAQAVIEIGAERMSIKAEEFQLAWDAAPAEFNLTDDDTEDAEEEEFGFESEDEEVGLDVTESNLQEIGAELTGEDEEYGEPYDVYAFGMYRHVLRRDLRTLSATGASFSGVQPTAMALAAAANTPSGVVIDIDDNSLVAIVVRDGLPEVIREAAINPKMSALEWAQAVTTQVSRAVGFHDSMYPDAPLSDDAPLYATGAVEMVTGGIDEALSRLPYARVMLPLTLRSPAEFPFDRYAVNVGLALLSGKRWWQRTRMPIVQRPVFDFRPQDFKPRPFPLRAFAAAALAVVLVAGLFAGYDLAASKTLAADAAAARRDSLERQVQLRSSQAREAAAVRRQIETIQSQTMGIIASADLIRVRDRGLAGAMTLLLNSVPPGVTITEINDDGGLLTVSATGSQYAPLLEFAHNLELLAEIDRVRIRTIGSIGGDQDTFQASVTLELRRAAPGAGSAADPAHQATSR